MNDENSVASAHFLHICTFSKGFIVLGLWQMLNIVHCLYCSVLNSLTNLLIQPDPRKLLLSPNERSVHPLWNCTCRVQFSGWYQESVPHLDQPRWVHNSSFCLIWLALTVLNRQDIWRTCSKIYRCNQEFDFFIWFNILNIVLQFYFMLHIMKRDNSETHRCWATCCINLYPSVTYMFSCSNVSDFTEYSCVWFSHCHCWT